MELNLFKYFLKLLRQYIFIFLTATIFIFSPKCIAEENVFTVNNVEVKGKIDSNFSREKYINKAFFNSFKILMNKILLSGDFKKINNLNITKIKSLIKSFQIVEESYSKNKYTLVLRIHYNDLEVKKFLRKKNISFSQPEKISAIFYPIFFIDGKIQSFDENYFYKNWKEIKIKNEIINYIMPIEDLEDILSITEVKNEIEKLNIENLVNKYDIKNYVFALIDYKNKLLNIYVKTSFNNNKISKNFSYKLENISDKKIINEILINFKLKITDIWKEENLINLLMPLSIQLRYDHKKIKNFKAFENTLKSISIINDYNLEKFSVNKSVFKIYYYGNPKKLKSELMKFGYQLSNERGFWQIYLNE